MCVLTSGSLCVGLSPRAADRLPLYMGLSRSKIFAAARLRGAPSRGPPWPIYGATGGCCGPSKSPRGFESLPYAVPYPALAHTLCTLGLGPYLMCSLFCKVAHAPSTARSYDLEPRSSCRPPRPIGELGIPQRILVAPSHEVDANAHCRSQPGGICFHRRPSSQSNWLPP